MKKQLVIDFNNIAESKHFVVPPYSVNVASLNSNVQTKNVLDFSIIQLIILSAISFILICSAYLKVQGFMQLFGFSQNEALFLAITLLLSEIAISNILISDIQKRKYLIFSLLFFVEVVLFTMSFFVEFSSLSQRIVQSKNQVAFYDAKIARANDVVLDINKQIEIQSRQIEQISTEMITVRNKLITDLKNLRDNKTSNLQELNYLESEKQAFLSQNENSAVRNIAELFKSSTTTMGIALCVMLASIVSVLYIGLTLGLLSLRQKYN